MKKLLKYIKNSDFLKFIILIFYRVYFRILSARYRSYSVVVMTASGIGDCCIAMAYLDSFKRKINNKVLLVACDQLKTLIACYSGYDRVKYIGKKFNSRMRYVFSYKYTYEHRWLWRERMNKIGKLVLTTPWAAIGAYNSKLDALVLTRDYVYCVEANSVCHFPIVNLRICNSIVSVTGKHNILFNPLSNSTEINLQTFKPIIDYFNNCGVKYNLFTSCKDENSLCLPGTERLVANIFDLYATADKFAFIVSTRSGILDFLITKNSRQIVLFEHNGFENIYNMDMWKCGKTLQMFYDDPQMMEKIDEYVKEIGDTNES